MAALSERGLTVAAVSAGGFYDVDDRPKRAFDLAAVVGAPLVVACVSPPLLPWLQPQIPPGTVLCVENHWYQAIARPEEQVGLLRDEPSLAACLDTGHGLLSGVRPETFVAKLGPRLGHVHLKDAAAPPAVVRLLGRRLRRRLLARPEPVFPGRGGLDVPRTKQALERAGFAGTVSLEYEGPDAERGLASLLELWRRSDRVTSADA